MTFTLPTKTKALWQIRFVCVIVFLCFICFLFAQSTRWYLITIISVTGAIITFVYLPLYIKSYKITVETAFISVSKGIIIKNVNIMPYPRLIYVQSYTTPLSSLFKMKILILKAARGWIFVPEMELTSCEHLLDHIRENKNG